MYINSPDINEKIKSFQFRTYRKMLQICRMTVRIEHKRKWNEGGTSERYFRRKKQGQHLSKTKLTFYRIQEKDLLRQTMKSKGKSLSFHRTIAFLFACFMLVTAKRHLSYTKLVKMTRHAIIIVENATKNLTSQLSTTSPTTKKWHFGVTDCWNTSLTEDERLDDDHTRLEILRNYADELNISGKYYVKENLAWEIANVYRKIARVKKNLGYSSPSYVRKSVIGHFNVRNPQEERLLDNSYLNTLENNLRLILHDFYQRISVTA